MKIQTQSKSESVREFQDVEPGTAFYAEGMLWLKCAEQGYATCLSDGVSKIMRHDHAVAVPNAYVVIEKS